MVEKKKNKESRKEYLMRFARIREKRILKRIGGTPLIFDEMRMLEALVDREVPTMMQHCILRVVKKVPGTEKEKFISAFNICAAVFQKNGYMYSRSFKMTGKGSKNNMRHQREKEASLKRSRYMSLVSRLWRKSMEAIHDDRKKKNR